MNTEQQINHPIPSNESPTAAKMPSIEVEHPANTAPDEPTSAQDSASDNVEDESTPAPTQLTEAEALTAARLVELLSQAEERGYRRARRELDASRPAEIPLWGNQRRIESDAYEAEKIDLDGEFLSRIRPAVWD